MTMTRAERRRLPRAKRLKELHDSGVPKQTYENGKKNSVGGGAVVPRSMGEIRALLSGRDGRFREPITRAEKRAYQRVWNKRVGDGNRGYTKPRFPDKETTARKLRQESQSRRWSEKRKNNNRKQADKQR